MLHSHIRHGVHHTLVTVQVLTLCLILPLCLHLPLLHLLEEALPVACRHHLEGDNRRQLFTAHGDIHRGEHARTVVLLHAGGACVHLVLRHEAKHVAIVAVFGQSHPALLLAQHVTHRR